MAARYSRLPLKNFNLPDEVDRDAKPTHGKSRDDHVDSAISSNNGSPTKRFCSGTLATDTWFWEVSALIFSAACLVAIGAILQAYKGQDVRHFYKGLTLSTIISILATTSKSALLFVMSAAIGQLKRR